jgi:hypothetical protein
MRALMLLLAAHVAYADEPVPPPPHGKPLPKRPAGNVSASFEYTHIADAAAIGGAGSTFAFGQHAAILPKDGVTLSMQDVVLGGASNGGFVYQSDFLLGPGHWFGAFGLGVAAGLGVDAITGHRIPVGMRVPVRVWGSVNLGPAVRIDASGEIGWIAFESRRERELIGRAGVYIGGRGRDAGAFLGFTARQALGTTMLTFGLGVGLAAAAID